MNPGFRNFKAVPNIVFGRGAFSQLQQLLRTHSSAAGYRAFVIDHYFKDSALMSFQTDDIVFYLDTTDEPKTSTVDDYADSIRAQRQDVLPAAVIGIGGGSTMDVAKAVSIMLTNPGKTSDYQGWDLVKVAPIFKVGVPTLSGTGAEVSRTSVLCGPDKKQGINSDHSIFDQIILDPEFLGSVPPRQRFLTAMDCYIHSVEAVTGSFLNEFSKAFAEKALDTCRGVFAGRGTDADLMVASLLGGYSIVYSEVGVCHALSYGLSYAFGLHHGEANCVAFNHLEAYYPGYIGEFRHMLASSGISLPSGLCKNVSGRTLEKMVDLTLLMEKPLANALGPQWREQFSRDVIRGLFLRM